MTRRKAFCFSLLLVAVGLICSCHDDERFKIEQCLPLTLQTNSDSIVFEYNSNRKIIRSSYYLSGQRLVSSNEFEYNSDGQLITLKNYDHHVYTDNTSLNSTYELEYASGLPSVLHVRNKNQGNIDIQTEFTHDDNKRLSSASIYLLFNDFKYESAGYRYEYDDNNNVINVFYKVRLNNNKTMTEVLARENTKFDEHPVFFKNSEELTVSNVYMYNYVPNSTNCLSAKVYYPDYNSHFVTPQQFEFLPAYDNNGLIVQLIDPSQTAQLYFNEALFTKATYMCK